MPNYPTISLCMIAKNESALIAQAISSVKPIVSEIILVDTGSTDNTCEIAKSLGAKVLHREWDDNFSAPRNLGIQNATGDWILVLDADEVIDPSELNKIQELTLQKAKCFKLTQRHYSNDQRLSDFKPVSGEFPHWEKNYGGYFESSLVRLFPNHEGLVYEGLVHELIEYCADRLKKHEIVSSKILLHHYGHTPEVRAKKNKGSVYTPLGQAKTTDNPADWKAFFELGVEHNNNGRTRDSAIALIQASRLNPNYLPTWLNLGYVLCELGQYKEAVDSLQKAINLDVRCAEAYCNLGVVYLRVKQFQTAEKYFTLAINLLPTYVNAFCNLGKTLCHMQRFSEAVYVYLRALDIMPSCTTAKVDLGTIYAAHNKFELAERYLAQAKTESPNNYLVNFQLAQVFKAIDKTQDAVVALKDLCAELEKEPNKDLYTQSVLESTKLECYLLDR